MTSKHTPGPWLVIAEVMDDVEQVPGSANARLIAKAPELLEALRATVGQLHLMHGMMSTAPSGNPILVRAEALLREIEEEK